MATEAATKTSPKRREKKSRRETTISEPPSILHSTSKLTKGLGGKDSAKTDLKGVAKGEGKRLGEGPRKSQTGGVHVGDSSADKAAEGKRDKSGNGTKKTTADQEIVVRGEQPSNKRKTDEAKVSATGVVAKDHRETGGKAKKAAAIEDPSHNTGMNSVKKLKQDQQDNGERTRRTKVIPQPPSPALDPKAVATTERSKKSPTKEPEGGKKHKTSKSTPKSPSLSPEPEPSNSEDDVHIEETSGNEENVHLHGFSTDDDSSDEDDAMDDEPSAFDVGKLPTIAKDDVTVKRKLEKARRQPTEDRGVLYLGRIPHGFYENQLKAYFSQFGTVTRVRLSRSKKTNQSKHYGFLEFDSSSVAQIVADTMDNYLLMGHILRCKVIPKNEVHPELWVGANRKWRAVPKDRLTRVQHNKPRTEKAQERAANRLIKRQNNRKRNLEEAGIQYDLEAAGYKKSKSGTA